MRLKIFYESGELLVVDKPAGISVHPGHGHAGEPTLVDLIEKQIGQPVFLVHRLDRDTSGVLLVAKTAEAKQQLQRQFERRTVHKTYQALVEGHLQHPSATIDLPIDRNPKNPLKRAVRGRGKPSVSEYQLLHRYPAHDLVEVRPKTGRTHQIRVHLAHIGHPLVGDKLYGSKSVGLERQWLHATELSFISSSGKRITIKSPVSDDLKTYLAGL